MVVVLLVVVAQIPYADPPNCVDCRGCQPSGNLQEIRVEFCSLNVAVAQTSVAPGVSRELCSVECNCCRNAHPPSGVSGKHAANPPCRVFVEDQLIVGHCPETSVECDSSIINHPDGCYYPGIDASAKLECQDAACATKKLSRKVLPLPLTVTFNITLTKGAFYLPLIEEEDDEEQFIMCEYPVNRGPLTVNGGIIGSEIDETTACSTADVQICLAAIECNSQSDNQ